MNAPSMNSDRYAALANQTLARALTPEEVALANAMEQIYATGVHDFDQVAAALERDHIKRPSGNSGPWTAAVLHDELKTINASLDEAYARHGIGA